MVFSRMTGLFAVAPFFSSPNIIMPLKLSFALLLAIVFHFGFGIGENWVAPTDAQLALGIAREFMTGASMGLIVLLIFTGISYAGSIVAPQMGMAVAQMMDPQAKEMTPVLSAFINLLVVIVFLTIDGHLIMIRAMVDSYRIVPIAGFSVTNELVGMIIQTGGEMFIIAFKMAAPVLAVLLFINTGLGIIARVVPQVNVFVVGFIIAISAGYIAWIFFLPVMRPFMESVINNALEQMLWLLKTV